MNNYVNTIEEFAKQNGLELLYLSYFGSKLYGTDSPTSDTDIKGIFLPKWEDLILCRSSKVFSHSTGNDLSRNTSEDFDFELYSIHNFLSMVERGDTGALDLLFSFTNQESVVLCDPRWNKFIENIESLFNPQNTRAFLGYCLGQISKYNLKGSRLKVLEDVLYYFEDPNYGNVDLEGKRLADFIDDVIKHCGHETYLKEEMCGAHRALRVLGSVHHETIAADEFLKRIKNQYSKYGHRAHSSKDAEGVDWKACSHSYRVLCQSEELLLTGKITFPLKNAEEIKEIKSGNLDYETFSDKISEKLDYVSSLLEDKTNLAENKFNKNVVDKLILSLY